MKVILDTNVYLSYILAPDERSTITTIVTACLSLDEIDLLVAPEEITEFSDKAAAKRYFRTRIPHKMIDRFVTHLRTFSDIQPPPEELTAYSRDPGDDYLVAYGIVHEVDFLVPGDHDLLVLGAVGQLRIVSPAQFLAILRSHSLLL
jgi:putative PIN family toxin of toxin-antitoxin system